MIDKNGYKVIILITKNMRLAFCKSFLTGKKINLLHRCCKFPIFVLIMSIRINWDFFGIVTSIACAIHCAVLPLLISSLPLFGINIIHNALFEWMMISIAFFIGSYAVLHGYRKHHKNLTPFLYFTTGFLFLLMKQFFHDIEFIFLAPAVFFILYAHFVNYRYCRQQKLMKVESVVD